MHLLARVALGMIKQGIIQRKAGQPPTRDEVGREGGARRQLADDHVGSGPEVGHYRAAQPRQQVGQQHAAGGRGRCAGSVSHLCLEPPQPRPAPPAVRGAGRRSAAPQPAAQAAGPRDGSGPCIGRQACRQAGSLQGVPCSGKHGKREQATTKTRRKNRKKCNRQKKHWQLRLSAGRLQLKLT